MPRRDIGVGDGLQLLGWGVGVVEQAGLLEAVVAVLPGLFQQGVSEAPLPATSRAEQVRPVVSVARLAASRL